MAGEEEEQGRRGGGAGQERRRRRQPPGEALEPPGPTAPRHHLHHPHHDHHMASARWPGTAAQGGSSITVVQPVLQASKATVVQQYHWYRWLWYSNTGTRSVSGL